jgi:hypothetical protein
MISLPGRQSKGLPRRLVKDSPGTCHCAVNEYFRLAMNPNVPPAPPPTEGTVPTSVPKGRRWLLWGCLSFLALAVIVVATVAITVWYIQRPIKPVVLSPKEKAVVEKKLEQLDAAPRVAIPAPNTTQGTDTRPEVDRFYMPGSKELRLAERELNGLLNLNTDLGKTLRFELGRDAINAYLAAPIPQDVPLLGGKMFRARGRFRVSVTKDSAPYAVLEDVTVFGVSLPKAWLGGLKGENLLADAVGTRNGKPVLQGVKSLRVEPGVLILELED